MAIGSSLFLLKSDLEGAFDASAKGISVSQSPNAEMLGDDAGFRLNRGFIELARHRDLDNLQAFTIEATITPEAVGGERRNIIEAQSPAIALFIETSGKLVGSVHTAKGWIGVDSGSTLIKAKAESRVSFTRDNAGKMELQINDKVVGSKVVPGPIQKVGDLGFKIGAGTDGQRFPFIGKIADVQVRQGVVSAQFFAQKMEAATRIEQEFKARMGLGRVAVHLIPDYGNSRLQPVKDIMNAVGVKKLSDLMGLRIDKRTVMTRGKVIVAAHKTTAAAADWSKVAKDFVSANKARRREILARRMTNRNSAAVLNKFQVATLAPAVAPVKVGNIAPIGTGGRIAGVGTLDTAVPRVPAEVLPASPTLLIAAQPVHVGELFKDEGTVFTLLDKNIIRDIESDDPAHWAVTSQPTPQTPRMKSIPIDSAVIIGQTIDLTDIELVIEPDVSTLTIIAERLICGKNAKITWRRPGGDTPPRAADPDLDGRGWPGVQTKPGSRDGLDGENARAGGSGIDGAQGMRAPNLELWIKDMSAMPNFDLNGEDGRKGGRGQRGGHGGEGGDGHVGEIRSFAKWSWCVTDPGDGGDGGDGGQGGRGGRGGKGGRSGNILIGVLEDTLESTVTNRTFKIKNQGGQRGRGGEGGEGGEGGRGGRSGVGKTCKDAHVGHDGAKGQPGAVGADAANAGNDGDVTFCEFTLDEWEALLKKPWVTKISPEKVFPGDKLTLKGGHFTPADRVIIGKSSITPTINADQSISITVPLDIAGGRRGIFVRRDDGTDITDSNHEDFWVKPQLDQFDDLLNPGSKMTLNGHAFVKGASVMMKGEAAIPATVKSATELEFAMPGTGGEGSKGGLVALQVRNPDGMVSNIRTAGTPHILEIPFRYGKHDLPFGNFTDGVPDWGTFKDTFGAAEVWHELFDPVFGHPVLTAAFFGFYKKFLKGTANGGLATGFCTSLASLVADRFWQGRNDTHAVTKASVHKFLTAVHGKLLSRESLIHFHDQGKEGLSRVEKTCREVETTFLRGCDRDNAPLIFFIPSGEIWDEGYKDKLSDSHCVMPYRFVYPPGHPGPKLSQNGLTTITDLDGVEMYVWDCNRPDSSRCRLVFKENGGKLGFEYFPNSRTAKFSSKDGITLGMMTNGNYLIADHDLPFSGPFGLKSFIVDFLLSPADLQITDTNGLRTGNFGGKIRSEIPDSHPCYLASGAYLLPTDTALTRRITGTGMGKYTFNSILPDGGSLVLQDVDTAPGQVDVLSVSADGTQIRFKPAVNKTFHLTLARQVEDQVRSIAILGVGGGPAAELDITISPELSLARIGNRGAARNVEVRAFTIDRKTNKPVNKQFANVNLPTKHDLTVTVEDWTTLEASVEALSFE